MIIIIIINVFEFYHLSYISLKRNIIDKIHRIIIPIKVTFLVKFINEDQLHKGKKYREKGL